MVGADQPGRQALLIPAKRAAAPRPGHQRCRGGWRAPAFPSGVTALLGCLQTCGTQEAGAMDVRDYIELGRPSTPRGCRTVGRVARRAFARDRLPARGDLADR